MFNLYKLHTFATPLKTNNTTAMAKRHLLKWNALTILLSLICAYSCTDNEEKSSDNLDKSITQEVIEVKNFLKDKALSEIDMNKTFSSPVNTFTYIRTNNTSRDFEPDWSTLQNYKDEEGNDVQMFELENESPASGLIYYRNEGKEKAYIHVATSKLVIWKLAGTLVGRIMTYIPDNKFSRDSLNNVGQLGYRLEDSKFSGIRLVSTLDGIFLYGDKYDEGQHLFHFLPTKIYRDTALQDSIQTDSYNQRSSTKHIYFKLFSEKRKLTTRATTYTTREGGGLTCSFCGKSVDECTCVTITPPKVYCPRCGMESKYCLCCKRCKNYPCICCKSCLHYPCVCCKVCNHYPCICCKVCHHYPCTCSSSGGGGGINPNPGENPEGIKPNIEIPYAAKDFPGYDVINDCYEMADYILHQMLSDYKAPGTSYYINKADKDGNIIKNGYTKAAFDAINIHLDANRPIKVGVDYKPGGNVSDHLTDHWIIVNGRGYDTGKQQYYFNYIETGRYKTAAAAAVGDNRLYYDSGKGTISGPKWDNKATYVVNQIKINIK